MSDDSTRQEFLTELDAILESDEAYGSNIQILTYSVKEKVVSGKFRDSWNNRVYEFIIDIDGISYKPAAKLDSFSENELPVRFDAYSKGYGSLFEAIRLDRNPIGKRVKKPKCGKEGYGCGFSCIGLAKTCRILSTGQKTKGNLQERAIGKERLRKLLELGDKILALGKKGALIRASDIKDQINRERSRKAGQLVAARKEKLAQRPTAVKETRPTTAKSDLTTNPKKITVDQEIFKTKFPPKEVQREYGQGGVIDRAKEVISFVQNPKAFNNLTPRDQAGFFDNITTVHGVGDKNHHETIKLPAIQNDEGRKMGVEASNIRAQGAKQIWDNLTIGQKTELAKSLKDIRSKLAEESIPGIIDTSNEFKNEYVNQLANEIRAINNPPKESSEKILLSNKEFKTANDTETREKLNQWIKVNTELDIAKNRRSAKGFNKKRAQAATEIIESLFDMMEYKDAKFGGVVDSQGKLQAAYIYKETEKGHYVEYLASAPWNCLESHPDKKAGAGASAMEAIVKTAINKNKGQIELESTRNAVPFYEKVGFKKQKGGAPDYPIMTLNEENAKKFLTSQEAKNRQDTDLITVNQNLTDLEVLEEESLGLFTVPQEVYKNVTKRIESSQINL